MVRPTLCIRDLCHPRTPQNSNLHKRTKLRWQIPSPRCWIVLIGLVDSSDMPPFPGMRLYVIQSRVALSPGDASAQPMLAIVNSAPLHFMHALYPAKP
jgi:hypothetical protein